MEFIIVFLKHFHWLSSPQTEFHIGDHIENTVFCEMVKLAHLFLCLPVDREMVRATPCHGLSLHQHALPAGESYLIYFWGLFPFTEKKISCFGKGHCPLRGIFSEQTQLSGEV